jgi:triacylglycerol lipase
MCLLPFVPMLSRFRKLLHEKSRDITSILQYIKLTLEGNDIDRLTDFRDCKNPVLLLYGFGATRRTVSVLEERLRRDNFDVFTFHLGGIFNHFNVHCIEELASLVNKKVKALSRRFGFGRISIIGHSKGGLIGRYYVQNLAGSKKVRTLITLGTPHNGNPLALLGLLTPLIFLSKSIRQFIPRSKFIRTLNAGTFPRNTRFVSIYSKADKVVYYKSSILEIPPKAVNMKNIELSRFGHSDLVMRKETYQHIKEELIAGQKTAIINPRKKKVRQKKRSS